MSTMSSSSSSSRRTTAQADAKISNDLHVLKEKMDLLESMIHNSETTQFSVTTNEAVRSVVGYLDACGPRMIELVTACTTTSQSVLSESVFGNVLGCNDRLQKLLSDVDALLLQEETEAAAASASSTAVAASASDVAGEAAAVAPDLTEQFGDLLLGSNEDPFMEDLVEPSASASTTPPTKNATSTNTATATTKAGAKTTGETDEDIENFLSGATALAPPPVPAEAPVFLRRLTAAAAVAAAVVAVDVAATATADPFDDFFAERTETNF